MDTKDSNTFFHESHRSFWEQPENYLLLRNIDQGKEYYSIFTLGPQLLFSIIEDPEYARKLTKKMIAHGVKVFYTEEEFLEWHSTSKYKK